MGANIVPLAFLISERQPGNQTIVARGEYTAYFRV
jgi:hypothetical protein